MKVFLLFVFICLFLFLTKNISYAVSFEISNVPSSIQKEEESEIIVAIIGAKASSLNFLRGAFYQNDTTSYFGYTYNHENNWYNASSPIDPKKFLQIQIDTDGNWSGILKVKPDINSSHFKGNGNYLFKVGRYTESASSVSDWSESKEIALLGNEPTPTLTPTPTKVQATYTPTKTPIPIPTVKPTKAPSATSTIKASITIVPTLKLKNEIPTNNFVSPFSTHSAIREEKNSVLGVQEVQAKTEAQKPQKIVNEQNIVSKNKLPIVGGVLFLCSACVILVVRKYRQEKELEI